MPITGKNVQQKDLLFLVGGIQSVTTFIWEEFVDFLQS